MATTSGTKAKGLNTGLLVKSALNRKRVTHAALARATHRTQSNISGLVKGSSTQAYILWELSLALRHNLFTDIAAQLDTATEGRLQKGTITIEALQMQVQQLTKERDILMKAVEKLSR